MGATLIKFMNGEEMAEIKNELLIGWIENNYPLMTNNGNDLLELSYVDMEKFADFVKIEFEKALAERDKKQLTDLEKLYALDVLRDVITQETCRPIDNINIVKVEALGKIIKKLESE